MKKIFTLMISMLLGIVGAINATVKQTTVFKGEVASGEWSQSVSLDKSVFANAKAGDILYVKWTLDTEAAIALDGEENAYYQFNVSFPYSDWSDKLVANTDVKFTASHYALTLTNEQVTKLKDYGIAIGARFLKITDVVFGDAFSNTEITYWGSDAWQSASTNNFEMPSEWSSCVLNSGTLGNANIGDRLTVTFITPGSSNLWDAQLQVIDASNSGWVKLMGIPVGGLTTMSLLVDEEIKAAFSRGDIRLSGVQLTITDIQLETTNLYYWLNAKYNLIDLSTLNGKTVNVDLTRKYDWNTTICVPFEISSITSLASSAKAYKYKELNGDELVFTEVESIEAGKPYLMTFDMTGFADEAAKTMTKSFEGVTINTTLTNTTASGLVFKGNYAPGFGMAGKYGVACKEHSGNWDWGFYKGSSTSTLPAFSAYIDAATASSRGFSISTGDGTTSIETFGTIKEGEDGPIYNLMGQKTNAAGKGIYIKNGKKYIAR